MGKRIVAGLAEDGSKAESGVSYERGFCGGSGGLFEVWGAECVGVVGGGGVRAVAVGLQFDGWDACGGRGIEIAERGFVQ